jgi:hypothetical protein
MRLSSSNWPFALAAVLLGRCRAARGQPRASVVLASWTPRPASSTPTQATIAATICRQLDAHDPSAGLPTQRPKRSCQYWLADHLAVPGGSPDQPSRRHLTDRATSGPNRSTWATVDQTENELNAEVCSGRLSLVDAAPKSLLKHTAG